MQTRSLAVALLILVTIALPAWGTESPTRPVIHQEAGQALGELSHQLESLHSRWRDHFAAAERWSERPLITIMLRHRDELGLSTSQVQSLEKLRADFQQEATRYETDLRAAESDLASFQNADPPDIAQVEAKVREIERLRAEFRIARIRTIEQGKAQLSPEQRSKLRALLAEPRTPRPRAGAPVPPQ
ncbi:MAG TPA: periplasmic heavy metal sensor, partial [Methylomirabilota bacterium]|nr:periplasmic heavy metal sensor [Methylomirabilota bacterium]